MDWHMHCPKCGYYGLGRQVLPGSDTTERFLWILLIVPGLVYRFWRKANARAGCSQCDWDGTQESRAE
jgi:hypothetical protein